MENEKISNVVDSNTSVEDTDTNAKEEQDDLSFDDTSENEDELKTSTEENKVTSPLPKKEVNEAKAPQTKEERAMYANKRREADKQRKEQEALKKKAYDEGRLSAYKGKINPYTNTEIKDMEDIEVYEDMFKLSEAGKDPLKDYASYVADKKRTLAKEAREEEEREAKALKEVEEFQGKYPDINLTELLKDEMFMDYAEGKSKTLLETYESYSKFEKNFRNKGIETAKKTVANSISSPGSLNAGSENDIDYNSMSREDFLKEVNKVKSGR